MEQIQQFISKIPDNRSLFYGFAGFVLLCIFGGLLLEKPVIAVLPFVVVFLLWLILDFRQVFYFLLFLLPLSIEFELGGGFATDLPTEPLMVVLMMSSIAYFLANPAHLKKGFINHPLVLLIVLHWIWIGIAAVFAELFFIAFKYFLAKTWYIVCFVFLAGLMIQNKKEFLKAFWAILLPLTFVVIQTLVRHALKGFAFEDVNHTMIPFFRNHVSYAVMLVIFIPYIAYARNHYRKGTLVHLFLNICLLLFIAGTFFSYTRAAVVCMVMMPLIYWVFKARLTRLLMGAGLALIVIGMAYYVAGNRYLALAPEFHKTISHGNLDRHLNATLEGNDLSFMERIYRWVAGVRMVKEDVVTGFGPGNFYSFYKSYAVTSFRTYVSTNEEKSGIHNYYLMILVEQGFPGLLLFITLCIVFLWMSESLYFKLKDPLDKKLLMAAVVSTIITLIIISINDLLEVDKIGSIFYLNIVLVVNLYLKEKSGKSLG